MTANAKTSHFRQATSSLDYLKQGMSLLLKPGVKRFVLVPLAINLVLLSLATYFAFSNLNSWYQSLHSSDNWLLQWLITHLDWLLWPVIVILVLLLVFFSFALLANWLAAPFNGLLAEAVEKHLRGYKSPAADSHFLAEIPRLFAREWRKLVYYLPRALACLLLFVTPLAFVAPLIWFVFNAWMAAIQYLDYPMDNHKIPFNDMLAQIRQRRSQSFGFGSLVLLLTMVPLVNILLMPVAVAGATSLWVNEFDHPASGSR